MQTWIIGNWKNNPSSLSEVNDLAVNLSKTVNQISSCPKGNVMVMPSTLHISPVVNIMNNTDILVGCQDVSDKSATIGAYTGDCSAQQLFEAGASWTLIGHSERRMYHQETSEVLVTKMQNALEQGLGVVYCIGEGLETREQGKTIELLQDQLTVIKMFTELDNLPNLDDYLDKIIIAYEPVWAIGTGKIPSIEEVESVHQQIRQYLTKANSRLAKTPLLYGGSVNPDNAELFARSPWVNGALIGGASLQADKFLNIADLFFTIKSRA